ncbi:zona pellucida glycoprotein 2, like 2 [Colossoma macropomum]|uniref:zona pellucida glycoprotein 2, like 2 n=1 Tax=Colossoma macropomum TaxID=42526 RepID=UPI001864FBB5|nr:zona pellucida glycoprotein 2, like 2 [Colossoma macropomum]
MSRAVITVFGLCAALCGAQQLKDPWLMAQANNLPNFVQQPYNAPQQGRFLLQQPSQSVYPPAWQSIPAVSDLPQRCEVDDSTRVGCGEPGITPADCEALNCCYDTRRYIRAPDGPLCYYGKGVTVQCTEDGQFVVVVARDATVPRISLESINMLEAAGEHCSAVDSNTEFAIYQFPFTSCGTRMEVEGDYIIYENRMVSTYEVGIGPQGAITRDSSYELTFQCRYLATAVAPLVVEVNTVPPPPPVFEQGPLQVELRLANGICAAKGCSDVEIYSSYYTEADYPVTKILREPVYVEVRMLRRTDPNLALVLNRCWATSSPDPSSLPQWDLLLNGCPDTDDRYLTTVLPVNQSSGLQYPTHYKRFVVKMFTFVDKTFLFPSQEQIFIHCATAVCQLSATETCEPSCGRKRRAVPTTQDLESKVLVSSGEVLFIADMPVSAKSQADSDGEVSQVFSYGLVGVAVLTVLSICGLLIALLRRRSKSRPRLQTTRL